MPIFDYKCSECGFTDEYIVSPSVPKDMEAPMICPSCHKGKMEKQFSANNQSFDIVGYCYNNVYGKKNWKRGKSDLEISEYLTPDPVTGNYKDPY